VRAGAEGVAPVAEGRLNLDAGYVNRALDKLPKQGDRQPWRTSHNYPARPVHFSFANLDDGACAFAARPLPACLAGRTRG
jgi:hypothetical protein